MNKVSCCWQPTSPWTPLVKTLFNLYLIFRGTLSFQLKWKKWTICRRRFNFSAENSSWKSFRWHINFSAKSSSLKVKKFQEAGSDKFSSPTASCPDSAVHLSSVQLSSNFAADLEIAAVPKDQRKCDSKETGNSRYFSLTPPIHPFV